MEHADWYYDAQGTAAQTVVNIAQNATRTSCLRFTTAGADGSGYHRLFAGLGGKNSRNRVVDRIGDDNTHAEGWGHMTGSPALATFGVDDD